MAADNYQVWARLGAGERLAALGQERAAILKAFPDLRRATRAVRADGRPKRKFSAAAKKRMAAGMRKYWAKRKAAASSKD